MADVNKPFLEQKSSSATESDAFLQKQFDKTYLEYSNWDAIKASYGLSDLNDRMSELKNIKDAYLGQKKTKMSADMLRLEFPEIADRIKGDGYFEDYARIATRARKAQEFQKIMENSPDTFGNSLGVFAGSIAGGMNLVDIGISTIAAASGIPFLAPFSSNMKFAGALNFATSNLVENIAAEPITRLSKSLDLEDYSYQDSMKNIAMGVISGQVAYTIGSVAKYGYGKYFKGKNVAENLTKSNLDEVAGKTFSPYSGPSENFNHAKLGPQEVNSRKFYKFHTGEDLNGIDVDSKSYLGSILPEGMDMLYDNPSAAKFDAQNSLGVKNTASYDIDSAKVIDGDLDLASSGIADKVKSIFGEDFFNNNKDASVWQMIEGIADAVENRKFSSTATAKAMVKNLFDSLKADGYDGIVKDMGDSDIPTNSYLSFNKKNLLNKAMEAEAPKGMSPDEAKAEADAYTSYKNDYTYDQDADNILKQTSSEFKTRTFSDNNTIAKDMVDDIESLKNAGILSESEAELLKTQSEMIAENLEQAKAMMKCEDL